MLLEVWKVHGLIVVKWPAIFFRQLCCLESVRPEVRKKQLCPGNAMRHRCAVHTAAGNFRQELWETHSSFKEPGMILYRDLRAINLPLHLSACISIYTVYLDGLSGYLGTCRASVRWDVLYWSWKQQRKVTNSAGAPAILWKISLVKWLVS